MELVTFIQAVKKSQKIVWSWLIAMIMIMSIIIIAQPLKYGATSELLIVQQYSGSTDPYSISRSNQYLSSMLASVVTSQSFYNEVMGSGFAIDQEYFNTDTRIQMKTWEQTVEAKSIGDSGMIEIMVYHPDRYQAQQIARAINSTLKLKNGLYRGAGSDLTIKVLNEPIVSVWPVKPNILLNLILAFLFGTLLGLFHVYARATGIITPSVEKPVAVKKESVESKINIPAFEAFEKVSMPITPEVVATPPQMQTPITPVAQVTETPRTDFTSGGDIKNVF